MDKNYVPNFKHAFEHFLVHTGGRAVIEEVEKKLVLDPKDVQPSKETLYRYGNTCCAAVFYVLCNVESKVCGQLPLINAGCGAADTDALSWGNNVCLHIVWCGKLGGLALQRRLKSKIRMLLL